MTLKNMQILIVFFASLILFNKLHSDKVLTGLDVLFQDPALLKGKKVGLITNQTAIDENLTSAETLFETKQKPLGFELIALFAPEHGLKGATYASESVSDTKNTAGLPIYSLHGTSRRPTKEQLEKISLLIFDIQDIGSRSYTYCSTLFYAMEEAAKLKIPVVVLDRPNPINGIIVDGPMLNEKWRSFVGYINVPYCHGMTIGELALFFNSEYKIGCDLSVIKMKGWKRSMSFKDTGLAWVPTSPNIPENDTPLYYPATGLLGELQLVSIGVGYTLPFKVVGAPWVQAEHLAEKLNLQKMPGVKFAPIHFKPFFGRFAKNNCEGIMLHVTDPLKFKPVSTQFMIIGLLKSLYPIEFANALKASSKSKELFCKVCGGQEIFELLHSKGPIAWKLISLHEKQRSEFLKKRKQYLLYN